MSNGLFVFIIIESTFANTVDFNKANHPANFLRPK